MTSNPYNENILEWLENIDTVNSVDSVPNFLPKWWQQLDTKTASILSGIVCVSSFIGLNIFVEKLI